MSPIEQPKWKKQPDGSWLMKVRAGKGERDTFDLSTTLFMWWQERVIYIGISGSDSETPEASRVARVQEERAARAECVVWALDLIVELSKQLSAKTAFYGAS